MFWGGPRGGDQFFQWAKGGTKFFLTYAKGGPEKIADRLSQTDAPPLPVKNDSSLRKLIVRSTLIHIIKLSSYLLSLLHK